jgi:hypothetical protein
MYNIYMNNPDYKKFISVLNSSIRSKKNDKNSNYHRFIQQNKPNGDKTNNNPTHSPNPIKNMNINFSSLFDEKERNKISKDFFSTISSDKFVNEVKSEYAEYKNSNMQKVYGDVDNFYNKQDQLSEKDKKAKEISTRFIKSVNNFITKHKDEYKQDGLLTIDGNLITSHPDVYIAQERKLIKEKYREENYSVEDIDKLMKLDQLK